MHKTYRRLGGLLLAMIMIPAFIGLMACMPVPIGNPERSKIDDDLTGVWIGLADGDADLFFFEPYDKRTWLLRHHDVGGQHDKPALELSYEDVLADIDLDEIDNDDCVIYKMWRTKLGRHWFVVWEVMGQVPGYEPGNGQEKYWFVWRLEKLDANRIRMYQVDLDYEGFESIEGFDPDTKSRNPDKVRRAVEKVIKHNIDDPDLYTDYDDEDATVFFRVTPEDFADL